MKRINTQTYARMTTQKMIRDFISHIILHHGDPGNSMLVFVMFFLLYQNRSKKTVLTYLINKIGHQTECTSEANSKILWAFRTPKVWAIKLGGLVTSDWTTEICRQIVNFHKYSAVKTSWLPIIIFFSSSPPSPFTRLIKNHVSFL